ncbi:MAG TPA: glycerol-3-phosphate 1-O-acyltransferase PlsY [Candidatus Methylomirabilis sp.]|nr:glycerol-3-phosphate 1-O-acyltransferase PlsY [Candidatus Methylomirabilis sp.]
MGARLLLVLGSYLLGSVPFGLLIGRWRGVDVRERGSRNIGATNVLRVLGKGEAAATLLLDGMKGAAPVLAARGLATGDAWVAAAGCAALLGHCFPIFLRFRGGKGVATGLGAVLAALPAVGLTALLLWLLTAFWFRYSSLAALVAAASLPVTTAAWEGPGPSLVFALAVAALITARHHENIRRLWRGEEQKIGQRAAPVS